MTQALVPATYIIIFERSPTMPILYVSSSIREALLYEPKDMIGHSPQEYMSDIDTGEDLKREYGSVTEDNIFMTDMIVRTKDNQNLFIRGISFVCGNVNFGIVTTFPHVDVDREEQLQRHRKSLTTQRYKCILSEEDDASTSRGERRNSLDPSAMYTLRSSYQACLVLEELNPNDPDIDAGPKIIFTTGSISRILHVDSCDLQGIPFLSLVAIEDSQKAYEFLEKALNSGELVLENLRLLANPLEEAHLPNPRSVSVEFMAKGSDDGAIMLCQLARPGVVEQGSSNRGRYISLEDIISSNPETSDFPGEWSKIRF
ncbi:hypothetical protein GGI12_003249 [Dipsacomyces acuminosporus]|nr:hypothetical protein GGI12_003249 [Dipsacomyces acuminosporus]